METPQTKYAKTPDGAYIAYQTVGDGPIDIVWQFDWLGNVDTIWEYRPSAEWFHGLASFSRLILHDRRGTGASSRNVDPPNLETRVADLTVVLDAVGSERPVLGGALEGGAPNILFAATFPERVHSLFWWYPAPRTTLAPDYPFGASEDLIARSTSATRRSLGHRRIRVFGVDGDAAGGGARPVGLAQPTDGHPRCGRRDGPDLQRDGCSRCHAVGHRAHAPLGSRERPRSARVPRHAPASTADPSLPGRRRVEGPRAAGGARRHPRVRRHRSRRARTGHRSCRRSCSRTSSDPRRSKRSWETGGTRG